MANKADKNKTPTPEKFIEKMKDINQEITNILEGAEKDWTNPLRQTFYLRVQNSAPKSILSQEERGAFLSFNIKYKAIPEDFEPKIVQDGEKFHLANQDIAKHIISELRPVIFNQKDPIYFTRIHNIISKMVRRENHNSGTKITVLSAERENDLTMTFEEHLRQCRKVIQLAIDVLELDYLYNGILQHADTRFSERYANDWHSGEIAYIYLKTVKVLTYLKYYLKPYFSATSAFWLPGHPRQGHL